MPYIGSKKNRDRLVHLMATYNVDSVEVGKILSRKPATVSVYVAASGVDIPDHLLELLELKLMAINPVAYPR